MPDLHTAVADSPSLAHPPPTRRAANVSLAYGLTVPVRPRVGDVQGHYKALWASYSNVIDFVNFQFYAYSSGTTVSQFLNCYEAQTSNYAGRQVLASFTTDGSGGLSPANGFFDACQTLKGEGKLAGIFTWTADSSKSNGFQYETQAQNLLAS
ncbi:hypothetical protein M5K25_025487 [Dendrobium thyrsiflorum]|uniref:GH18 domain-containing protein n=1 Tax=Dendrobium thyrsiflorum TaxID=117978 RepID=A0ABD0U9B6_DENTH